MTAQPHFKPVSPTPLGNQNVHAIKHEQSKRLQALLRHALISSPMYRELVNCAGSDNASLSDFPILTKRQISEYFPQWGANCRISKDEVEWFLENSDPGTPIRNEFLVFRTSGTMGQPGTYLRHVSDLAVQAQIFSERVMPFWRRHCATSNNDFTPRSQTLGIYATGGHFIGNALWQAKQRLGIQAGNLVSIHAGKQMIIHQCELLRPEIVFLYASMVEEFCDWISAGQLKCTPRMIVSTAEKLGRRSIDRCLEVLKTPPADSFSTTETWQLAFGVGGQDMYVHDDLFVIEPLNILNKRDDESILTNGIVVTDLRNFDFPLIRYLVPDLVWLRPASDSAELPLSRLSHAGRDWPPLELHPQTPHNKIPFSAIRTIVEPTGAIDSYWIRVGDSAISFVVQPNAESTAAQLKAIETQLTQLIRHYDRTKRVHVAIGPQKRQPDAGKAVFIEYEWAIAKQL